MGMSPRAHLAYGYDLGSSEDFKAAERDENGGPALPWLTDDDEEGEHDDFGTKVEELLLGSVGFTEKWTPGKDGYFDRKRAAEQAVGVEVEYSGHADYPGWMLIARDSGCSVEWAEAMAVDLDELTNRPAYEGWDTRLTDALAVLGITPTQDGPKWLIYPTYG